ncbi:hypothetical protein ABB02_00969 [Clostridiaceae bacterium JG1575]|nr:hypothetical protein ABB02_00969 [Clostridiaceae bacterium JG1575]
MLLKETLRRTMRRFVAILCILPILAGCKGTSYKEYRGTFFTVEGVEVFNTVFTVIAWESSPKDWETHYELLQKKVLYYHQLFDIYHTYEGINNVKTINDEAGKKPVKVDAPLIDLIVKAKQWAKESDGRANIALGPVTELWHEAREHNQAKDGESVPEDQMKLPTKEELKAAASHVKLDAVQVDEAASTVFLKEPSMRLDLGAIAKGYATEEVAKALAAAGMKNGLMSAGGNIKSFGAPNLSQKKIWSVGVTDPKNPSKYLADQVLLIPGKESVVSSGDYERYFTYKGKRYHHLIDPNTLQPGDHFAQVTVVTEDSAKADFYSTTLFLMTYEQGVQLAQRLNLGVAWVFPDGTLRMNDKVKSMLKP